MRRSIARWLAVVLLAILSTPSVAGFNVQGMWWRSPAGSESGWGINVTQQGNTLFATWFTYDSDGSALWLVMPATVENSANTYSGRIYRTRGPSFDAASWNAASVTATDVGSATFAFSDESNATFTFSVDGVSRTKAITRQVFATAPYCAAGARRGTSSVFQDLWWADPPGSESGWGVNVAHQGDILFATWFTYDSGGKGMWLVVPSANRVGASDVFTGDLYRTTGPAFSAEPWDPHQVVVTRVGQATFSFADNDHGTFSYAMGTSSRTKAITRQVYSSPATVCRPADARNGEYKLLSTNFNEYTLAIDFDRRTYAIRSNGAAVSAGTFTDPVDGTYTFEIPGYAPARNNARFRTAENLIVGSHPLGGSEAMPFVAANRFVRSAPELPITDMWMFSSDVEPASSPVVNSRIMAIRLAGNFITYCTPASGPVTTVTNCLLANLTTHPLTFNADGSVTWLDAGVPVNLHIARSGGEIILVRAQSYPSTTGNRRFQIALQDAKARDGTYEGGVTSGSWGTTIMGNFQFLRSTTTSTGVPETLSGVLASAGPAAAPLHVTQGSDGVAYFAQGTGVLGAHIAGRGSLKAGTLGFGLLR